MMGEHKFKVGDRVRRVNRDNTNGFITLKEGAVSTVAQVTGDGWLILSGYESLGSNDPDCFEPVAVADSNGNEDDAPTYKKGDRVRLVKDGLSTTGAVGKLAAIDSWARELRSVNGEYLLKIDPPLDYKTLSCTPEYTRATADCFELVTPLTIQAGKFYRTRDGRKVGPMVRWDCYYSGYQWESEGYLWKDDGENYEKDSEHTIVAEWVDEPVTFANGQCYLGSTTGFTVPLDAPEFGGGEAAATKFKVGDRVETHGDFSFDPGVGTVAKIDGDLYVVTVDGHGGGWNYYASELRLVAEATSGKDTINRVPWVKQAEENVVTIADIVRRLEALEAKRPDKLCVGDNVELALPARVSGFHKKKVHVAINGGSYTLPAAALKRAA